MREGALGLTVGLIYPPDTYAQTAELITLAREAGRHGGIFSAHIRNEGPRIAQALDEVITIGREAAVPVEVYHLKLAGKDNWGKLDQVVGANIDLRHPRRGDEQPIPGDTNRDVALAPGDEAAVVEPLADADDLMARRTGPAHQLSPRRDASAARPRSCSVRRPAARARHREYFVPWKGMEMGPRSIDVPGR
jgi:hypothetical protein